MNAKYNSGSVFQGKVVNKKKTRRIKHEHFPKLPHVQQMIKNFENLHNDGPEGCYPCQSFTGALWSLLAVGFELA
jgi:hypothetical protein